MVDARKISNQLRASVEDRNIFRTREMPPPSPTLQEQISRDFTPVKIAFITSSLKEFWYPEYDTWNHFKGASIHDVFTQLSRKYPNFVYKQYI